MKFWNWFQERRHNERGTDSRRIEQSEEAMRARIGELEETVDRLVLAAMAMWSLRPDQQDVTEEDLLERIREYDVLDGRLDGRLRAMMVTCDDCGRRNRGRRTHCLFCGSGLPKPGDPLKVGGPA